MKLAEALSIRADLQRKVSQLRARLKDSSKVQEGDTPAEQISDLFLELEECLVQLEEMVYRINHTNMQTFYEGETITVSIPSTPFFYIKKALADFVYRIHPIYPILLYQKGFS